MPKPVLSVSPLVKSPPQVRAPARKRISFSFRYWSQADYFGLHGVEGGWFVSLLEKLTQLSELEIDGLRQSVETQRKWRYHAVDFLAKNCPARFDQLDSIPEVYRSNPDEYPVYQFEVTTGLGRIHGFWDEADVFNIVLLDHWHNLQPSKRHNYQTRVTSTKESQLASLLGRLDAIVSRLECECPARLELIKAAAKVPNEWTVVIEVSENEKASLLDIVSEGKTSINDVLNRGILACESERE